VHAIEIWLYQRIQKKRGNKNSKEKKRNGNSVQTRTTLENIEIQLRTPKLTIFEQKKKSYNMIIMK
jgi:hypothetical protein